MNIKSVNELVNEALKEIKTISAEEALENFENEKINLIDIRDIRELEKEEELKIHIIFREECWNFGWILIVHISNKVN